MSQMLPEPTDESTGVPAEPVSVPTEPAAAPSAPIDTPLPAATVPSDLTDTPLQPLAAPPRLASSPGGPDWRRLSADWMQKSEEITARWLYDLGGWIFGGLIVAALMLLQDLISLGFTDRATLVAGLAIAIALPFNLAGLGVIRYFNALNQAVEEAKRVLGQSANLDAETLIQLTRDSDSFSPGKHRVMDSSVSLALYLSVLFTVIGLSSALWRISWVATVLFLIASVCGVLLVLRVIRSS